MGRNSTATLTDELPEELARRLSRLHGASDEAIAECASMWELGDRRELALHGIIDYDLGEDAADHGGHLTWDDVEAAASRGEPMDFGLTDAGRQAIADYASRFADTP